MSIELVPFSDLAAFLGLKKAESSYLDLSLIQQGVVSSIENYLHRSLEQNTYSETVFLYESKMLPVKGLPISSVSSVLIDNVVTDNYIVRLYGIELKKPHTGEVSITYTGGLTEVPAGLSRAALLQTVYEYNNKESLGIRTVTTEGGTTVKSTLGLLDEVKTLLNQYKHPYTVC